MIRLTYRSPNTGTETTEDLVGPSHWEPVDYRKAIRRQRPGIEILGLELIPNPVPPAADDLPRYRVTMRLPGRPSRTVFSTARTCSEAVREALAGAPSAARLVSCVGIRA